MALKWVEGVSTDDSEPTRQFRVWRLELHSTAQFVLNFHSRITARRRRMLTTVNIIKCSDLL